MDVTQHYAWWLGALRNANFRHGVSGVTTGRKMMSQVFTGHSLIAFGPRNKRGITRHRISEANVGLRNSGEGKQGVKKPAKAGFWSVALCRSGALFLAANYGEPAQADTQKR